jgi:hypothetical protein
MPNSEKIQKFKRLYVATHTMATEFEKLIAQGNINEKELSQALANIDEMLAMLPFPFPKPDAAYDKRNVLLIHLKDAEQMPVQIVKDGGGFNIISLPPDTTILYEQTTEIVLENWKFNFLNTTVQSVSDKNIQQKYIPKMLAQAEKCMSFFPETKENWMTWEEDRFVLYANQLAWYSTSETDNPTKLEKALAIVERGFKLSNWEDKKYIKDTKVRILLKLNRPRETFPIVLEAFHPDKNDADFQDLKNDATYLEWLEEEEKREAEIQKQEEEEYQRLLELIKETQNASINQFKNPANVLVQQHAQTLNLIKQKMIAQRMQEQYYEPGWKKLRAKLDTDYKDDFSLKIWTEKKINEFEKKNEIRLPDELKVYLMEIGEGGGGYFNWGAGISPKQGKKNTEKMKRNFPITSEKIHDIGHYLKVKAWVYPDEIDSLKEVGIIKENADAEKMFGLPKKVTHTDGCMFIGDSMGQNELWLVLNGEFEGEVWSDTLQYGLEARGCFGAATPERRKFLGFIAGSLLAHSEGYPNDGEPGDWL